jgi:cation transport ATPase
MKILFAALAALGFATSIAAAQTPPAPAATTAPSTIEMQVDGLVCAFCAQGIEKTLRKQPATADVYVNLERKLVAIALKPQQDITDGTLKNLLTESGYTVREMRRTSEPLAALRSRAETP